MAPMGTLLRGSLQPEYGEASRFPSFRPLGSVTPNFRCQYPSMLGWSECQANDDNSCWLRSHDGTETFDIYTDYETNTPLGIDRYYNIDIQDVEVNLDGRIKQAKVYGNLPSGAIIEACWGDRVHINVTNRLKWNGTSLHAHGIRQYLNMHMDGVGGLTQCPIAPGDWFLYTWNATQYGSSWCHSHYSMQTTDGAHLPMVIHGPVSANFDEGKEPLVMQDSIHNSGFQITYSVQNAHEPNILLNGRGNLTRFNGLPATGVPKTYQMTFEPAPTDGRAHAKRYLLHVMNVASDAGLVFSIDNHYLQVVQADFVPIEPYWNTSVFVAIGQRYTVIVEARPISLGQANPLPGDGNYWIRTILAPDCARFRPDAIDGYERIGILRYNSSSNDDPTSHIWPDIDPSPACIDENYNNLKPIVPWFVGPAANGDTGKVGDIFKASVLKNIKGPFALAYFLFEPYKSSRNHPAHTPFRLDFGNPTILNLDTEEDNWPIGVSTVFANYSSSDWVYLTIIVDKSGKSTSENPINHHPIHLHGHDFAILQQAYTEYHPSKLNLTLNNPPRRDTVLLDVNGFVVIAFKSDNPGAWLLHCHIPLHAAGGMAMQMLERQSDLNELYPHGNSAALTEARRVCRNWNSWRYDCKHLWPGNVGTEENPDYPSCREMTMLQNDSGV